MKGKPEKKVPCKYTGKPRAQKAMIERSKDKARLKALERARQAGVVV